MDQPMFTPYPGAPVFLSSLKDMGLHIIIASHREKGTLDATARWLRANKLLFDEIHLSYDKTALFDDCWCVIDDSPFTLQKAERAGILGAGLKMPWNETGDFFLFDDLKEVLQFLKDRCGLYRNEAARSYPHPIPPINFSRHLSIIIIWTRIA
jgi:hypothetical protein